MKKILVVIFAMVFTLNIAYSQGGSNYSVFGFGDIEVNPTSSYDGLAGTSIAFPLPHSINPINPAVLSKSEKTRLLSGYRFNQNIIEDDKSNILFQNNGQISSLSTLFVIDTSKGITATFGFNPYTSVNYLIRVPIDFAFEGMKITGRTDYQGHGGITMVYLGGSANVLSNLSVGALAFATFGIINSSIATSLYEPNAYTTTNQISNKFNGFGLRFGVLYEPIENLFAGAYLEQHSKMEFEQEIIYGADLLYDSTYTKDYKMFLPGSFGFGASYLIGKFRIGGDYKIYNLKDMDYNQGPNTEYRNMQVFSIAVSRLGNTSINAQYVDKITYNFGLGYKELYYKINAVDINEIYGSFGLNLPLTESAIIDASLTLGRRGSSSDKFVQEFFGRLTIDVSIGETWFKPFKREY